MTVIRFKCKAKTSEEFRVISVDDRGTVSCDCESFIGVFCSHVDATLIAGERFMVPEQDRSLADKAMSLAVGRVAIPSDWRGAWRKNNVWRGLAPPRGPRQSTDLKDEFGGDYYSRPKVCFTGNGPVGRKELLQAARETGWQAVDDFQSGIKVLVAEDPTKNTNKLKQARKLGVPILSYDEWTRLNSDGVIA